MNHLLEKIMAAETFSSQEAKDFIYSIDEEKLNSETIAAILVGIQIRGIQLQELVGFRSALLELCNPIELDSSNAIDLCGTGGDGKNTFNISTTSSLILAAMGKKVIKHGNYGVSSTCGSSNVLEELGFVFSSKNEDLTNALSKQNICFLHAPLFHPTMKKVAPIRKALGVRTIFNALGPLVNPAQPAYQLTGTYNLELARIYQHVLKNERNDFRVVYGMDGYDEITLTDNTRYIGKYSDEIVNAESFGQSKLKQADLFAGNTTQDAAKLLTSVLKGNGTNAQNAVVAANVASALQILHPNENLPNSFNEALSFIKSGQGSKHFKLN
ncbi:MAG: anthranilate phosphoribosyltransferase [Crocinitomicaceae bacterium]|jgi:anthranilate phosphoribosyltransferase